MNKIKKRNSSHRRNEHSVNLNISILRELYTNSKVTYRELEKKIGVSSVTCYNRITEMKRNGIIEGFTININPRELGYTIEVLIELKVRRGLPRETAKGLYKLPNVEYVWEITGQTDLIVRAFFRDVDELNAFLHEIGNRFPQIENIITHVVLGSYRNPNPWF